MKRLLILAALLSGCGGTYTYYVPVTSSCFPDADEGVRVAHGEAARKCKRVAP